MSWRDRHGRKWHEVLILWERESYELLLRCAYSYAQIILYVYIFYIHDLLNTSFLLISCAGEASLPGLACTDEEKTASGWALSLLLLILICGPEDWVWSVLPWAWDSFSGIWVWPAAWPLRPLKGLSLRLARAGGSRWAEWSGHDGTAGCEDGGWCQWIQSKKQKLIINIVVPQ